MNNLWLAARAAALGLLIGAVVFLTLHLVLDATALGTVIWLVVGGALATALVIYVRRAEVLRNRQTQGYFVSAMMIAGITLAWLPPGTIVDALRSGAGPDPASSSQLSPQQPQEASELAWTGIYPNATAAVQQVIQRAKQDFALSDTTVQNIEIDSSTVIVAVFDPTADVVRAYTIDRDGTLYEPSLSSVDPSAINEFALSAVQVSDLNALFDEVTTQRGMTPTDSDALGILAPAKGAAPRIVVAVGAPADRTAVYTDATGQVI